MTKIISNLTLINKIIQLIHLTKKIIKYMGYFMKIKIKFNIKNNL